jgi:hypothetical protein
MMWTHHMDRMLQSPEGDGSGGGGATTPPPNQAAPGEQPAATATGDFVPRTQFVEAIGTRDAAKERARLAEAENVRLAAELEQLKRQPAPSGKPPEAPTPTPPDAGLTARLDKLEREQADARRAATIEQVANAVAPSRRGFVKPIITGLLASGAVSMSTDVDPATAAAALLTTLRADPSMADLFAPEPGSARSAVQVGLGGKADYSQVNTLRDFGDAQEVRDAPDEVIRRIANGKTGNQRPAGMIAGSGREAFFKPRG